ncbi:MAG: heat-inducible transcriptional repressor HrcA [Negativicutes bacterium]|nr:heat-inducible transcriptional repressor HrcA [Negativicutes bacterium]
MAEERKWQILRAIIDDYIATAEPIGSRTIARKSGLGISPATVRNEMSDLEEMGFLEQPHTSAGRVPSLKAYRYYVDCLMSPPVISEQDIAFIDNWYRNKVRSLEEVFQETAKIIARFTRNVSLVVSPQFSQCRFRYLQFLPLDDDRAIAVVVTDNGLVENRIINIPGGVDFADLQRIAQAITNRIAGQTVEAINDIDWRGLMDCTLPGGEVIDRAVQVVRQTLLASRRQKIHLGGTTQILDQPEFRDSNRARNLLSVLEEERVLCDILDKGNEDQGDGLIITIGRENKFSGIQDCSIVQATYRLNGQTVGKVAVLGPTRMEYGRISAILGFMRRHIDEVARRIGQN